MIDRLAPGLHSVRVSKAGYSDYKISVSLEEDRQTDLQVALAARATMAMPQVDVTGLVDTNTEKMESGAEARTALFVVNDLPEGTTIFVGSKAVAQAGDDGRATIKLDPGVHEIQVTAPSGVGAKRMVTVSSEDGGSLKTIKMPLEPASVVTSPMTADFNRRLGPENDWRLLRQSRYCFCLSQGLFLCCAARSVDRHKALRQAIQSPPKGRELLSKPSGPPKLNEKRRKKLKPSRKK